MGQEPTITLSIKEAGERPNSTYLFHILQNGTPLTSNQSLSLPESQAVREGKAALRPLAGSSWEKITKAVPVGALRFLVIASDIPEILNLPW